MCNRLSARHRIRVVVNEVAGAHEICERLVLLVSARRINSEDHMVIIRAVIAVVMLAAYCVFRWNGNQVQSCILHERWLLESQ